MTPRRKHGSVVRAALRLAYELGVVRPVDLAAETGMSTWAANKALMRHARLGWFMRPKPGRYVRAPYASLTITDRVLRVVQRAHGAVSPLEIASAICEPVNSVRAGLFRLERRGDVRRVSRGQYVSETLAAR
jgi:predicted transcriptional regulator of viral defense system